jgi:hypothetical protein
MLQMLMISKIFFWFDLNKSVLSFELHFIANISFAHPLLIMYTVFSGTLCKRKVRLDEAVRRLVGSGVQNNTDIFCYNYRPI